MQHNSDCDAPRMQGETGLSFVLQESAELIKILTCVCVLGNDMHACAFSTGPGVISDCVQTDGLDCVWWT